MMLYNKGDTFKTADGLLGLVLNDGMPGCEFYDKYNGMNVPYIATSTVHTGMVDKFWQYTIRRDVEETHKDTVYYSVLIGDIKGWMELDELEARKRDAAI